MPEGNKDQIKRIVGDNLRMSETNKDISDHKKQPTRIIGDNYHKSNVVG